MKLVIFSDVQGNYDVLNDFFNSTTKLKKDEYVCLGDIVDGNNPFKDNLCLQLVRENCRYALLGNHDKDFLNAGESELKIFPDNLTYLKSLPPTLTCEDSLMYHSSLVEDGKRLRSPEDYAAELEFLSKNANSQRVFFHGHSHVQAAYSYDLHHRRSTSDPTLSKVELEKGKIYLFNPGGLGLRFDQQRSFLVYDTQGEAVTFYEYDSFKLKSETAGLAVAFEERWCPSLQIERVEWFFKYAEADAKIIRQVLRENELSGCLLSFNKDYYFRVGQRRKQEYLEGFSKNLAVLVNKLTLNLKDEFDMPVVV
ncbi:metallophosphoesterase family protein [Candidatus Woesearchaeota archaeon]|nr:metallophosphoesterase family protein [Candidatus Woesearchaeota archaeon]